jgi:hypothetical protein
MLLKKLAFMLGLWCSFSLVHASEIREVKEIWTKLDRTQNQCTDIFDYYPNGGLLIFYCHVKTFLDAATLGEMAKMPIFLSGPHLDNQINSKIEDQFGHYNPEFVRWLINNALPNEEDKAFIESTQSFYNPYMQSLAQVYFVTYLELMNRETAFFEQEVQNYFSQLTTQTLPLYYHEKYYDFAQLFEQGYDGNVVKGAVGFWIRRHLDGTADLFYEGLNKLLRLYDPLFFEAALSVHGQTINNTFEINQLQDVWGYLELLFSDNVNCEAEKTWMPEVGMRGFYCHVKKALNTAQLQGLAGVPIFLSGPHNDGVLNLDARFEFGHYNPEFVQWLKQHFLPETLSAEFVENTYPAYNAYVQPLARTYHLVYRILQREAAKTKQKQLLYLKEMKEQTLSEFHTTYNYLNFAQQYPELQTHARSDFEVASAVTFWLRRMIDGTAPDFAAILTQLLSVYDSNFLEEFPLR